MKVEDFKLPKIQTKILVEDSSIDTSKIIADLPGKLNNILENILQNTNVTEVSKKSAMELAKDNPHLLMSNLKRYRSEDINYIILLFESQYRGTFNDCCSAITNLIISILPYFLPELFISN